MSGNSAKQPSALVKSFAAFTSASGNVEGHLEDAGKGPKRWLKGQVLAIRLVGVFTGLGLCS